MDFFLSNVRRFYSMGIPSSMEGLITQTQKPFNPHLSKTITMYHYHFLWVKIPRTILQIHELQFLLSHQRMLNHKPWNEIIFSDSNNLTWEIWQNIYNLSTMYWKHTNLTFPDLSPVASVCPSGLTRRHLAPVLRESLVESRMFFIAVKRFTKNFKDRSTIQK